MVRSSDLMPGHIGLNRTDLEQSISSCCEVLDLEVIQESVAAAPPCGLF